MDGGDIAMGSNFSPWMGNFGFRLDTVSTFLTGANFITCESSWRKGIFSWSKVDPIISHGEENLYL